MFGREERHTGRVGDTYVVRDVEHANSRAGNTQPTLEAGDTLVRTRHSGDCFSDYAIMRNGKRAGRWAGYDLPNEWLETNVVDDVTGGER